MCVDPVAVEGLGGGVTGQGPRVTSQQAGALGAGACGLRVNSAATLAK